MNRWFSLFIGMWFSVSAEAQPHYQLDSVVRITDGAHIEIAQQEYDTVRRYLRAQYEIRKDNKRKEGTRHTTRYDEYGNELEHVYSSWDTLTNRWIDHEKTTKTYDDKNRMISHLEYISKAGEWVGLIKNDYTFEERALITMMSEQVSGQWVPIRKQVDMFNGNKVNVLSYTYQWDSLKNDWGYDIKHDWTFSADTLLEESIYHWSGTKWQNKERTSYIYHPDTKKLADLVVYTGAGEDWQYKHLTQFRPFDTGHGEEAFYWSVEEDKWKPESFKESYMDKQGRVTDYAAFKWNKSKKEYIRSAQGITVYDAKDRIAFLQEAQYDDEGKGNNGIQKTYSYDEDDNLYREIYRSFHPRDGWITQRTKEFIFNKAIIFHNEQGQIKVADQAQIGTEDASTNRHAIERIVIYKHDGGKKVLEKELKYYYSPIP